MNKDIIHIKSIAEVNKLFHFPSPKHPLVMIMWAKDLPDFEEFNGLKFSSELFMVSLKDGIEGSLGYGRNNYDFSYGTMVFSKPNQVMTSEDKKVAKDAKGWVLLFHPDLIRRSELGKTISNYSFFDYEVHEALHLSVEEQQTVTDLILKIESELNHAIDKHSQRLMVSNLELLLNYCMRYYDRQFYVRTNLNQDHVSDFEQLLKNYFDSDKPTNIGLPTVKYCGEQLHMSPNYLSDLLKKRNRKKC